MEVRFIVKFLNWEKDQKVDLDPKLARRYIYLGVAEEVVSRASRKAVQAPPRNKMVKESENK